MLLTPLWQYFALFIYILLLKFNGVFSTNPTKHIIYSDNIKDEINLYMGELLYENDNTNYSLTLTVNSDENNIIRKIELGEFYSKNIVNGIINIKIPDGICQDGNTVCSFKISFQDTTAKKFRIIYSQFFQLTKTTQYKYPEKTIYMNLSNDQELDENSNNLMFFTRDSDQPTATHQSVTANPTRSFKNYFTSQPMYERVPIHTKDLEDLPNTNNIQDKSINALLKLDDAYDSNAKFPLTARKLHFTNN
ncbi:hypothetical protein, no similarity [Maudiozyma saulgeensis]|uniref:Uncharacterized protein n=1 Tax=Maudiozyma saulgeensis TaxID=1789683 RepID=A0A1X7R0A7_9SACH|nr:hypothetical protein, no similarity [Kazachstania saulgeensis]